MRSVLCIGGPLEGQQVEDRGAFELLYEELEGIVANNMSYYEETTKLHRYIRDFSNQFRWLSATQKTYRVTYLSDGSCERVAV